MFAKIFRNTLVASTLLIGTSLFVIPAALAAPVADDGDVQGNVSEINSIGFAPQSSAIVPGVAQAEFSIGTLTIQNNAAAGWTLDVESENGGYLLEDIQGVPGTHTIPYTALTVATVAGAAHSSVSPTVETPSGRLITAVYDLDVANEVGVGVTANIGAQYVPVGLYTDNLTFTLTSR